MHFALTDGKIMQHSKLKGKLLQEATPPKLTAVAPVKLVPVMVTDVPVAPLVGVKEEMVGAG